MKIAVDLNGGDYAPQAIINGIKLALSQGLINKDEIIAIGSKAAGSILPRYCSVEFIEGEVLASDVSRKSSSVAIGIAGVKTGQFNAFVSAGNTKIVVGLSVATLGRLNDGLKPAIAVPLPMAKTSLLVDIGAALDRSPKDFLDLAVMGQEYAKIIWPLPQPTLSLLNIGAEPSKGGETLKQAYQLLRDKHGESFLGNIEGDLVFEPNLQPNVVICDGLIGNIILKIWESLMKHSQIADWQEIGGLPLLGVNGVIIVAHGKSSPAAICSAIISAAKAGACDINAKISSQFSR